MPIPGITDYTGNFPDLGNPATFDANMTSFATWFEARPPEFNAMVSAINTALNDDGTVLDTAGEAIALTKNAFTPKITAGTAAAYTLTPEVAITAYSDGQTFTIEPHTASAAGATLAVGGLAALPIQKKNSSGTLVNIEADDFAQFEKHLVTVIAGGTVFEIVSTPINDFLDAVALDEDDFASDSPNRPPSQQSTAAYVATQIGNVSTSLEYVGQTVHSGGDTSALSFAGINYRDVEVHFSLALDQAGGIYDVQARVATGTWRTLGSFTGPVGANDTVIGVARIRNFNNADGNGFKSGDITWATSTVTHTTSGENVGDAHESSAFSSFRAVVWDEFRISAPGAGIKAGSRLVVSAN